MKVLVDSSAWIAYFRGAGELSTLDGLIEEGFIVTNELILAELTPPLLVRGESKLVGLLHEMERVRLAIDWDGIVKLQVTCLRKGINHVGIPDLIIAQQAIQNDFALFSLGKHFPLLSRHFPLNLHGV